MRDEAGVLWVLQKVGTICSVTPAEEVNADSVADPVAGQLVVITLRDDMPDVRAWAIA